MSLSNPSKPTIHVDIYGEGVPAVFLHGWGINAGVFEHLIDELPSGYAYHLVDLPGFGRSNELSLPACPVAVAELLNDQIPHAAHWLGWSLGGVFATQLALSFPEKVKSLITLTSSPCFLQTGDWPGMDPKVMTMFQGQLAQDFAATIERFMAIQAMGSRTARKDIVQIKKQVLSYPMPHPGSLKTGLALLADVDLRAQLSEIDVPWLQMFGRLDSLVPHAVIEEMAKLNPQAEIMCFEKASHAPFISHPEAFVEALSGWLTRQQGF